MAAVAAGRSRSLPVLFGRGQPPALTEPLKNGVHLGSRLMKRANRILVDAQFQSLPQPPLGAKETRCPRLSLLSKSRVSRRPLTAGQVAVGSPTARSGHENSSRTLVCGKSRD